jgi:hypothetical protein
LVKSATEILLMLQMVHGEQKKKKNALVQCVSSHHMFMALNHWKMTHTADGLQ